MYKLEKIGNTTTLRNDGQHNSPLYWSIPRETCVSSIIDGVDSLWSAGAKSGRVQIIEDGNIQLEFDAADSFSVAARMRESEEENEWKKRIFPLNDLRRSILSGDINELSPAVPRGGYRDNIGLVWPFYKRDRVPFAVDRLLSTISDDIEDFARIIANTVRSWRKIYNTHAGCCIGIISAGAVRPFGNIYSYVAPEYNDSNSQSMANLIYSIDKVLLEKCIIAVVPERWSMSVARIGKHILVFWI